MERADCRVEGPVEASSQCLQIRARRRSSYKRVHRLITSSWS